MTLHSRFFVALLALVLPALAPAAESVQLCGSEATPCVSYGARVFQQRCALCHGSDGLGGGALPLSIKDYPNANLLVPRVAFDAESLRRAIVEGPRFADVSPMMPPWGDELTHTQIESVTRFVALLRTDPADARALSRAEANHLPASPRLGRAIFLARCVLCHGPEGRGDGRLAARLDPKPSDLTRSNAPDNYLRLIIAGGGPVVGRSASMPTWEAELGPAEIGSLVLYLNTLRPEPMKTAQ